MNGHPNRAFRANNIAPLIYALPVRTYYGLHRFQDKKIKSFRQFFISLPIPAYLYEPELEDSEFPGIQVVHVLCTDYQGNASCG